jgi:hypothetical protein
MREGGMRRMIAISFIFSGFGAAEQLIGRLA